MIFTTSWDDGQKDDVRLAGLLEKYGATGTFYISPPSAWNQNALSDAEIKQLSEHHEVGAHTMTHPKLTSLSLEEAKREIEESKEWVESRTGKPCTMFCYPYGDENAEVRGLVQKAGFTGSRGVQQFRFNAEPAFCIPTTLQVRPFPFRREITRWWHPFDPVGRLRYFFPDMCRLGLPPKAALSWLHLATALFDKAMELEKSSLVVFHLWGHSREIEKHDMWDALEKFLKYVNEHENVAYCSNNDLL